MSRRGDDDVSLQKQHSQARAALGLTLQPEFFSKARSLAIYLPRPKSARQMPDLGQSNLLYTRDLCAAPSHFCFCPLPSLPRRLRHRSTNRRDSSLTTFTNSSSRSTRPTRSATRPPLPKRWPHVFEPPDFPLPTFSCLRRILAKGISLLVCMARRTRSRFFFSRISMWSRRNARTGHSIHSHSRKRTATITAAGRAMTRRWRRSSSPI